MSIALALGLRLLVDPALGERWPFVTFYLAIAVTAWFGGLWPGVFATVIAYAIADWFVIAPRHDLALLHPGMNDVVGAALYGLVGVVITGLMESMRRTAREREKVHAASLREATDRKRIEDELREREAELESILSRTPFMLTRCSRDLRYLFVSRAYAEMLGRQPDEIAGKSIVEIMGQAGFDAIRPHVERVLQGSPVEYESDVPFHGVGPRSLHVHYTPDRNADGQVTGWIASILDVTERKGAQALLTANVNAMQRVQAISTRFARGRDLLVLLGEILDAAIETTHADFGNIQLLDRETGFLEIVVQRGFGREFLHFFGAVNDETAACGGAKRTHARVVVEDVHADPIFQEPQLQAVMRAAGVRAVQSTPLFNRNGDLVGVLSTHFRARHRPTDADLRFVDVFAQQAADLVEHARAEERREELVAIAQAARAESEQAADKLRRVQRIADAVLVDLPADELLHEVLVRVRETLGADTAVILVKDLEEEGEGEELRVRAAVGLDDSIDKKAPIRIGEYFAGRVAEERRALVWNDADPALLWAGLRQKGVRSLAGVPLLSGDRLLGVLHVGSVGPRAFTAEEVELLRLAGERIALGIERAARRDAERRRQETAEAANRAKDEFLAMLGHELRNPLSAVRNALATASLDESRRPRALEVARRQCDHLGRLVDDLLDVARITQGRIALRKRHVSLHEVIERAIENTRSFVEGRGIRLNVALSPEPLRLEADPTRLEQVFINLLSNAGKYTDAGGRIDLRTERQGDEVAIRVRDTGIGIAPDLLPRLWDLFTQADRSLDRAQGGLGIGLTVARRLVELHGGRIEARSEGYGKGAEFVVILGGVSAVAEEPCVSVPEGLPRESARVLLVEDNPDAAESMVALLETLGHRVTSAFDGAAGLDVARATMPDVMLVDIGLPGMDGYEVARRVRREPALGGIVLVALTGYGRAEDKQLAMTAGFDHHLVKPVDPDALDALVSRLAGERRPVESVAVQRLP